MAEPQGAGPDTPAGATRSSLQHLAIRIAVAVALVLVFIGIWPSGDPEPSASAVEHFSSMVPGGLYTIVTTVTDSATGSVRETSMQVAALPADVRASDLILSSEIRRGDPAGAPEGAAGDAVRPRGRR